MSLKIAIVDDHKIFRDGFRMLLESFPNIHKVEEYISGEDFIANANLQEINLAFMDIDMPGKNGIETVIEIKEKCKTIKIIALTSFDNADFIDRMIVAGAEGYLLKDADYKDVKNAITKVLLGGNYFCERVMAKLTQRMIQYKNINAEQIVINEISEREMEVLKLICLGTSRSRTAEILGISERTVDKHKENLIKKTDTQNTVGLVLFAIRNNLIKI